MSSSGSEYEPDELDDLNDEDFQLDTYKPRRRKGPARGGGRARARALGSDDEAVSELSDGDTAGPDESGYTTGGYTTGEDDDEFQSGEMFGGSLDPLALLEDMEAVGPPGQAADGLMQEPFQVLRKQRRAAAVAATIRGTNRDIQCTAAAARQRRDEAGETSGVEDSEGGAGSTAVTDAETDAEVLESSQAASSIRAPVQRGPAAAGGTARTRALRSQQAGGGAAATVFGADFDEIVAEDLADDPLAQQLGLVDPVRGRKGRGTGRGRRSRGKKGKRKRGEPSEEVAAQLAEANLLYANPKEPDDYKKAVDLLLKVIKAAPNLSDPYHTLGMLHEALGNSRKALDFHMIAAHLTPKDISLWKRLAALSTEVGYLRQAIYCLSKAVAHSPGRADADARWDRALLHAELGELGKAARQFEQVAALRPGDPEVPKMLARLHHRQGLPRKAIQVMEQYMHQHSAEVDLTHINILAELYMETGQFEETHNLIVKAQDALDARMQQGEAADEELTLPMDLVAKDGLCLAHLGRIVEAEEVLGALRAVGPATYPDLYLDVGVALVAMGQYAPARTYLQGLLDVPEFGSDPALWARLLMCHRALGDLQAAVKLYDNKIKTLTQDDPNYLETAITLCELWMEAGQQDEAAALLRTLPDVGMAAPVTRTLSGAPAMPGATADTQQSQAMEVDGDAGAAAQQQQQQQPRLTAMSPALLMRKNKLHLMLGQQQEFIEAVLPMVQDALAKLASDNAAVANPSLPKHVVRAIMRRRMLERRGLAQSRLRSAEGSLFVGRSTSDRRREHVRKADEEAEAALAAMEEVEAGELGGGRPGAGRATALRAMFTDDDGLNTFNTLCRSLVEMGRVGQAQELSGRAVSLCGAVCRWFPRARRDLLALLLADVNHAAGDIPGAMKPVKSVLSRWPASCHAWSLLSKLGITSPSLCSTRAWTSLIATARKKLPSSLPAMMMQGHVHLMARQYNDALSEYFQAYRFWANEPLLLLCIGVAYISHAISRRCDDRNKAILQGFAFLQMYEEQRGNLHESSYNIGRAAHQLGLLHIAQHYYERALASAHAPQPEQAVFVAGASQPGKIGVGSVKGLTAEIAHNLALIYKASGATQLVRELYVKYLTVL